MQTTFSSIKYNLKFWFTAALLITSTGLLQFTARNWNNEHTKFIQEPTKYWAENLNPKIINRLLGIRLMVSDLLWVDTLVKSDIKKEKVAFTTFYKTAKAVVQLNPDNYYAYYMFGIYLSVIKDDFKGATEILRDGVTQVKLMLSRDKVYSRLFYEEAWRIYFALGYNLLFEEHDFEEGSKWIIEAGKMQYASQFTKMLAEKVTTESGRYEVASRILNDVYKRMQSPEEKKIIEKKLLDVAVGQELAELNEKFQAYLIKTGTFSLPKKKAFSLFMKYTHHKGISTFGKKIEINELGKIIIK